MFISLQTELLGSSNHDITWKVIKTLHFDIYCPDDITDLAIYTSKIAEESYVYLANCLKHELNINISLIIHPANTRYHKRDMHYPNNNADRIELSFKGSYSLYHEELTHMLTHSFQYDMLYNSTPGWKISYSALSSDYPEPVIEGMALYLSEGYDVSADMIIRDIIYSNKADKYFNIMNLNSLKKNRDLSSVLLKSFYYFLETEINQEIIADLLLNIKDCRDFYKTIELATGASIKELNVKWNALYKQRHSAGGKATLPGSGKEIIAEGLSNSTPLIPITAVPDGMDLSFLPAISKHVKISKVNNPGNENINILLYNSALGAARLQDVFFLSGNPSVSGDNKTALFAERADGRDIIALYNLKSLKKTSEIKLPFIKIMDAGISTDGKYIVFSGQSNSSADLYIYSIKNKNIRRITNDLFCKRFPKISSDNSFVIFSSNENPANDIESKQYKIIKYDLISNTKLVLVDNNFCNIHSDISADGKKIIYASNISGAFNIYYYDVEDGKSSRITDVLGCALFPRWLPDNKVVLFTAYQDFKYKIISKYIDKADTIKDNAAKISDYKRVKYTDPYFAREDIILNDYSSGRDLKVSSEAGVVVWDNSFAVAAGIKAADFLQEHELKLNYDFLKNNSDRNSSYYLEYEYLKYSLDIGFGSFYVTNSLRTIYFYDGSSLIIYPENKDARNSGIYGFLSYPFAEGLSAVLKGSSVAYENIKNHGNSYKDFYSNELSFSFRYDTLIRNKLWPISGTRCELTYSHSFNGRLGDLSFSSITFNFNNVFQFNKILALNIQAGCGKILGEDSDYFNYYAGGFGSIRGHDLFSFSGQNAALFSMEMRFTVFERLTLKWPAKTKFNDICLALFADFGSVWDKDYKLMNSNTGEFEDLKAGFGTGIRFFMMDHIIFKLDAAWPYYYNSFGECGIVSGFNVRF